MGQVPVSSASSALLLESRVLNGAAAPVVPAPSPDREREIVRGYMRAGWVKGDQLARFILLAQWALAIGVALFVSPSAWQGRMDGGGGARVHLTVALLAGVAINGPPLLLIMNRPGWWLTRQTVAAALALWSALTIHLCGGRLESHFHVFAALTFLGLYRDWTLIPTALVVIVGDHLVRGALWPA